MKNHSDTDRDYLRQYCRHEHMLNEGDIAITIIDGIIIIDQFSVGWNFHHTREVKSFGLALSFAHDRVMMLLGPLTLIWIYR